MNNMKVSSVHKVVSGRRRYGGDIMVWLIFSCCTLWPLLPYPTKILRLTRAAICECRALIHWGSNPTLLRTVSKMKNKMFMKHSNKFSLLKRHRTLRVSIPIEGFLEVLRREIQCLYESWRITCGDNSMNPNLKKFSSRILSNLC